MVERRSSRATTSSRKSGSAQKYAVRIIQAIYRLARTDKLLDAKLIDPTRQMLREALRSHDTGSIYNYWAQATSLTGIADRTAIAYMGRNGSPTWKLLSAALARKPSCPKLASFWHYDACQFSKNLQTCARPDHFRNCPVPKMRLRNGRLNITAWSLFLFINDVADGNIVKWVGQRIRAEKHRHRTFQEDRNRLLNPLNGIYGVANKVLSMVLADLLLAAPPKWHAWNKIGGSLIVIDSLVHNNLVRTGILARYKAEHQVGPACYQPRGCADIVDRVALQIGAAPRAVTHAIWRYCAQDGFDICNGNRIDDRRRCRNKYCRLYRLCSRKRLHMN